MLKKITILTIIAISIALTALLFYSRYLTVSTVAKQDIEIMTTTKKVPASVDVDIDVDEADDSGDEAGNDPQFAIPDKKILHSVPFISQAPHRQWNDPIFQDGCEEASMIMALGWVNGEKKISNDEATKRIMEISDFEKQKYGFYLDVSTKDTSQVIRDYYNYENIEFRYDISKVDIIEALYSNAVVIVPADGRKLGNPYFVAPGPEHHMLVIIGYDPKSNEFITNEPGTRRGSGYHYNENVLYGAIRDYVSGYHEPVTAERKAMIIVKKN